MHGSCRGVVARRQRVHVVKHSLLAPFGHVPESIGQAAGVDGHEVLVTLTPSLSATVPRFSTDFLGVLAKESLRLGRLVGVVYVERRCAERVTHFEDAHVHPGTAAGVRILWTG